MILPTIAAGAKLSSTLEVPAGSDCGPIQLPLLQARGQADGPRIAILGGVHGDEYEGIASAATIWRELDPAALRGTLTIISVCNPPAFDAGTRVSPIDGLNLARTFPGREDGTVTERIAYVIGTHVIRSCDFLFDLHSAGQHYAMPLLAGAYAANNALGERCEAAALAFGAPVYWAHPDVAAGRSLSVAVEADIPNMYVECGGGGRVRPADFAAYRSGVSRVLAHLGALPRIEEPSPPPSLRLRSTGDLDTWLQVSQMGILVEKVAILDHVWASQTLGQVLNERGEVLETLTAQSDGVVIMARRTARVRPGDGAYMIALPEGSTTNEDAGEQNRD